MGFRTTACVRLAKSQVPADGSKIADLSTPVTLISRPNILPEVYKASYSFKIVKKMQEEINKAICWEDDLVYTYQDATT